MPISIFERGEPRSRGYVRKAQSFVLSPTESGARNVPALTSDSDRAALLGCPLEDLTFLDYGQGSRMWMSQSSQISDEVLPNKSASHALVIHGIHVLIRGTVLVEHEERKIQR